MHARTEKTLRITLMLLSGVMLAAVLFLLALTQPRFGTPFANWALGVWGPDGSKVERAHLGFPALTTVFAQGLDMPGRIQAQSLDARVNIFGFLPYVSWVSRLQASDGRVRLGGGDEASGDDEPFELKRYRRLIDELALSGIELRLVREAGDETVLIEKANGSLRSGALDLAATGAESRLEFVGSADASTLSTLNGTVHVTGDNFADLAALAGLAAPDTPPYDIVMDVDIAAERWALDFRPETRVGDSDLSGMVIVSPGGETPVIDADLRSGTLDADDLGIVFGIPIGVGGGETVGEEQARARAIYERSDRLIPNVVIDFARLDAVDGHVRYTAHTVVDSILNVRGLELDFEIEGRVVRAPLLRVDFNHGSLTAYATIDGTQSPAMTTAEGTLQEVALADLALGSFARGTAEGEFKARTSGDGFRAAAAGLEGTFALWSTDAEILALAVEGAGLDLGEALTLLGEEKDERTYTAARCAAIVADFQSGIGTISPGVVDTDDSLVVLRGDIDLGQEELKLSVRSEAKDASLGTLIGDVGIGGTLRRPQIEPFSGKTIAQFGIAALLGSLSGGLAALPFIEPGMAEDAPCAGLLQRAETAAENSSASN